MLYLLSHISYLISPSDHDPRRFPTPIPIDHNRHCVLMSLCPGFPLTQVKVNGLGNPKKVYDQAMGLVVRLAE